MGRRSEQRVAISFSVSVRGIDPHGNPFSIRGETRDISCTGACLKGLTGLVESGNKIEIQCEDQGAMYRVQWVGEHDGPYAGWVGVRCLEPGRYIWGVPPKEWEPDTYDPENPVSMTTPPVEVPPVRVSSPSWSGPDRRQFVRHPCRIDALVMIDNGAYRLQGRITDISLGGCYVEMMSPLPVDTMVDLSFKLGDTPLYLSGRVRSSQPNMGMGLSFTGMKPADFEKLRRLAPPTSAEPVPARASAPVPAPVQHASRPSPLPSPARQYSAPGYDAVDLPATAEAFQAVVRVLLHRGLLTRAELMEELEKLKALKTAKT